MNMQMNFDMEEFITALEISLGAKLQEQCLEDIKEKALQKFTKSFTGDIEKSRIEEIQESTLKLLVQDIYNNEKISLSDGFSGTSEFTLSDYIKQTIKNKLDSLDFGGRYNKMSLTEYIKSELIDDQVKSEVKRQVEECNKMYKSEIKKQVEEQMSFVTTEIIKTIVSESSEANKLKKLLDVMS